jgi:hypothetical protein
VAQGEGREFKPQYCKKKKKRKEEVEGREESKGRGGQGEGRKRRRKQNIFSPFYCSTLNVFLTFM